MSGPLSNSKQESYCRHRAGGLVPAKAALASGYAAGSGVTTELERDPDVIARIQELVDERRIEREQKREAAKAAAKTVGEMTGMSHAVVIQGLYENALMARNEGDFRESNAALKLIGDHLGMWGGQGADGKGGGTGQVPHTLNADVLDALVHNTDGFMDVDVETQIEVPDDDSVKLLVGERAPTPNRAMRTGSETDAVLKLEPEDVPPIIGE